MPQNPEESSEKTAADVRPWTFKGDNSIHTVDGLPAPPRWRQHSKEARAELGAKFRVNPKSEIVAMVNAALLLRRPLLVTGTPGTGKSTLAEAVATELSLGPPLVWPITTKTTLESGLYQYDALARLNAVSFLRQRLELKRLERGADQSSKPQTPAKPSKSGGRRSKATNRLSLGRFLRLGPLGTAMLPAGAAIPPDQRQKARGSNQRITRRPRVLLIDEIDKSDIDLPNDLLHIFERCRFEIPELSRLPDEPKYRWIAVGTADEEEQVAWIERGQVVCDEIPLVIMTSNGEREFPPAFLRRCLQLKLEQPSQEELLEIVRCRLSTDAADRKDIRDLVAEYCGLRDGSENDSRKRELAVDQLLNAVHLVLKDIDLDPIKSALFKSLSGTA